MQAALSHKLGSQIEEKGESDLSISVHLFLHSAGAGGPAVSHACHQYFPTVTDCILEQ